MLGGVAQEQDVLCTKIVMNNTILHKRYCKFLINPKDSGLMVGE